MNPQSPWPSAFRRPLSLFLCLVVAAAAEECGNPGPALNDALVSDDGDLPLSLMQVKAIATRNNKTHHSNQTTSSAADLSNASTALPMLPGSRFVGAAVYGVSQETLRAFYFAVAILILVLVVNSSMLYAQLQRQDTRKKQSVPIFQLPVDHLVASSKLNLKPPQTEKSQLRFYTRASRSNSFFNGTCPTRASPPKAAPDQLVVADKPQCTGEPLDAKLVLPLRETWYAVAIEQVLKADGSFEILRITGCPSLRASVSHSTGRGGGSLELFCCSGGAPKHLLARATSRALQNPPSPSNSDQVETVELADGEGRCLGELRHLSCKSFELVRDSKVVVTLAVDQDGQLELSSSRGRLACVSCLAGHLGICVNAGEDTALVICLVLAAVLLGGAGAHVLPKAGPGDTAEAIDDDATFHDVDLDDEADK